MGDLAAGPRSMPLTKVRTILGCPCRIVLTSSVPLCIHFSSRSEHSVHAAARFSAAFHCLHMCV